MPVSRIARATASAAAVTALAAGFTVAQAGPAAAGAVCTVAPQGQSPIYTEARPSAVAHWINQGTPVGATGGTSDYFRVYHSGNGDHLGYMWKGHLDCSAG
ncbi:hypothetical protein DSC45_02445 [Streptomyces sp. YIM 130001]|uniref:hypothetical protein n=1 Tax=Streptomyces sp. YIM 130001 TaxID=2259644 RepID=UPI000E64DCB7|nr:hypothetical protein [Streptomyces sp. YIM 130001]RII20964.1 hypothetical protein DSC45_02445 [Streptomyces sp. YIM 130001]